MVTPFNPTPTNQHIADVYCNKSALWTKTDSTTATINVALESEPLQASEDDGRIVDFIYVAECMGDTIPGMRRNEKLTIEGIDYKILGAHTDPTGWASIELDKL
jgi:hypothetical protein